MASHWLPEDDFRLRKSIENGASLESLAKGAVKFSRKFTLSELTDRWYSILYDPQVTSLSSSHGFDLQYSDQFLPKTYLEPQTTRVRSQYYSARKRIRLEEEEALNANNVEIGDQEQEHVFGGGDCEFFDMHFDESDFEIIRKTFPNLMDGDVDTTSLQEQEHLLFQEEEETPKVLSKREESFHSAMLLSIVDPHPEILNNGVINCTLNQQEPEPPNNDDIFIESKYSKARNSNNPSSSSLRKHMKPPLPPSNIKGPSSSLPSKAKGNNNNGFGDCVVGATEASCSSFNATTTTTPITLQHQSLENEICNTSKLEEEQEEEIGSDEDLPTYSDVEAMILDMDLEPVNQDRYEVEASRYQNEAMARNIMRLEQCSKSIMNRDIASHGAFAILYGSSKYYINKPEVLLGRDTGEYPVDIDLGKLGPKVKISRKQALIRLKQDGSFEIKNLGKYSIWMNDKEINQWEVVNLDNNSLIQIRGISFIFETNEKAVKRYLDGTHN